jgi:hypothetical protein
MGDGKGDFSKLSKSELEAIEDKWTTRDDGKIIAKSLEDMDKSSAEYKELEEVAEALGVEVSQELLDSFASGVRNYKDQEDKINALIFSDDD